MKYILLLAISLASTIHSMQPAKNVIDKNEDEQMEMYIQAAEKANNYKNARVLIPAELILELHPDSRPIAHQYNNLLNQAHKVEHYKEAAEAVADCIKNNTSIPDSLILQADPILRPDLYEYNNMRTQLQKMPNQKK